MQPVVAFPWVTGYSVAKAGLNPRLEGLTMFLGSSLLCNLFWPYQSDSCLVPFSSFQFAPR